MNCERGDVVLVTFPNSDLVTAKRRPALVVQADDLDTGLPQVIVAAITGNLERRGHASRVFVSIKTPDGKLTGLHMDSVIVTDNLATIRTDLVEEILGKWTSMESVNSALRHTLALDE